MKGRKKDGLRGCGWGWRDDEGRKTMVVKRRNERIGDEERRKSIGGKGQGIG